MITDPNKILQFEKRRALTRQAKQVKRLRRPPVWLHPRALEREYQAILVQYVNQIEEETKRILFPALSGLVADAIQSRPRVDDYSDNLDQMIQALSLTIDRKEPNWQTITMDIGQKVSKWNSAQWQKSIKQVMGVNAAQYEPWLQSQLNSFSKENVALIQSIQNKSLSSIEANAQRAIRAGKRHEEIAREILDEFDTTRARARLIARDQVSKLNGQLTQLRQTDVGVKEYIWKTSGDERVRPSHAKMDGKRCRWDDPTVYRNETGEWVKRPLDWVQEHPGQDYQCRCWAMPVFSGIYEEADRPAESLTVAPAPVAPLKTKPGKMPSIQGEYLETDYKGMSLAPWSERTKNNLVETIVVVDKNNKLLWGRLGKKDEVEFNRKEGEMMSNRLVVHNHPRGTPFSAVDLTVAAYYHVKEMRVIGPKGTFRFIRTKQTQPIIFDEIFTDGGTVRPLDGPQMYERVAASNEVKNTYNKYAESRYNDIAFGRKTDFQVRDEACAFVAKKYGWKYEFIAAD